MPYELINDLSESRSYRSRYAIATRDKETTSEFFYAVLLTCLALLKSETTKNAGEEMFSRASAFGNFDYFRISINDLYSLTYITSNEYDVITQVMQRRLLRIYRLAARNGPFESELEPLLLRLERMINNKNAELRMARRVLMDWKTASKGRRLAALYQLRLVIRRTSMVCDVLPFIEILIKEQ